MLDEIIEIFKNNNIKRTNCISDISSFADFNTHETELLEYITKECYEDVIQAIKQSFKNSNSKNASIIIEDSVKILNEKYQFGFLKDARELVEKIDVITDINQIKMKSRHIIFLNKLKIFKPDIEEMFLSVYNRTHKYMSPDFMRAESVFIYIWEELEKEFLKVPWGKLKKGNISLSSDDFFKACKHRVYLYPPYFTSINYVWVIMDSFGFDNGDFNIIKPRKLEYRAGHSKYCMRFYSNKEEAQNKIKQLETITRLAKLDITWEAICVNLNDIDKLNSPVLLEKCDYNKFEAIKKNLSYDTCDQIHQILIN